MNTFYKAFDFYLKSSIHVALAICSLEIITHLNYRLPLDWSILVFLFSASIIGYNFSKNGNKLLWDSSLKPIIKFTVLWLPVLLITLFLQSFHFILLTGILGLITFFYNQPVGSHKNLRNLRGIKTLIIGFVWSIACVWLPLIGKYPLFRIEVILDNLTYFILVLILLLPFEIRDLSFDEEELGTIPQRLGIKKTQYFGYFLIGIFILLTALNPLSGWKHFFISMFIGMLSGFLLRFSRKEQSPYYSAFWVESIPIIWLVLLLIF